MLCSTSYMPLSWWKMACCPSERNNLCMSQRTSACGSEPGPRQLIPDQVTLPGHPIGHLAHRHPTSPASPASPHHHLHTQTWGTPGKAHTQNYAWDDIYIYWKPHWPGQAGGWGGAGQTGRRRRAFQSVRKWPERGKSLGRKKEESRQENNHPPAHYCFPV